jgi:hypothetical protein
LNILGLVIRNVKHEIGILTKCEGVFYFFPFKKKGIVFIIENRKVSVHLLLSSSYKEGSMEKHFVKNKIFGAKKKSIFIYFFC